MRSSNSQVICVVSISSRPSPDHYLYLLEVTSLQLLDKSEHLLYCMTSQALHMLMDILNFEVGM